MTPDDLDADAGGAPVEPPHAADDAGDVDAALGWGWDPDDAETAARYTAWYAAHPEPLEDGTEVEWEGAVWRWAHGDWEWLRDLAGGDAPEPAPAAEPADGAAPPPPRLGDALAVAPAAAPVVPDAVAAPLADLDPFAAPLAALDRLLAEARRADPLRDLDAAGPDGPPASPLLQPPGADAPPDDAARPPDPLGLRGAPLGDLRPVVDPLALEPALGPGPDADDRLALEPALGPGPDRDEPLDGDAPPAAARTDAPMPLAAHAGPAPAPEPEPEAAAAPAPPREPPRPRVAPAPAPATTAAVLWVVGVPVLLLLVGAVARVVQWAGGRSLWLDEALIANSLVQRDFYALTVEPLLHSQAAPLLWLWAERLCVVLGGPDERAMRVVPLLSGLALLWLVWKLAREVLPAGLVPVALVPVALSPQLIYYSNEVKPYATEAAVLTGLLLLAVRARRTPPDDVRPRLLLGLAGAAAVWAAYASVLALAGLSALLVLADLRRGGLRAAARTTLVLSPWLGSLGVAYLLVLRRLREVEVLEEYWGPTFPQGDLVTWARERAVALAEDPLGSTTPALALLLLLVGLVMALRRPHGAGAVAAPVPFAVGAAAMSAYPFAGRLALWLVPVAGLLWASALPARVRRRDLPALAVVAAALGVVLAPAAGDGLRLVTREQEVEELEPVLRALVDERRPGDLVYVHVAALGAFGYYARLLPEVERDGVVLLQDLPLDGQPCADDQARRTGQFADRRVWIVFSHDLVDTGRLGTREDLLARITEVTSPVRRIVDTGAAAVLLDPTAGALGPQPDVPRHPERCLGVVRSAPQAGPAPQTGPAPQAGPAS